MIIATYKLSNIFTNVLYNLDIIRLHNLSIIPLFIIIDTLAYNILIN